MSHKTEALLSKTVLCIDPYYKFLACVRRLQKDAIDVSIVTSCHVYTGGSSLHGGAVQPCLLDPLDPRLNQLSQAQRHCSQCTALYRWDARADLHMCGSYLSSHLQDPDRQQGQCKPIWVITYLHM